MEIFKKPYNREKITIKSILQEGATVVDVRSKKEFETGNVPDSINISLSDLKDNIEFLRTKQPLVLCCASGMRSSMAVKELKENGIEHLINGGSWQEVNEQMQIDPAN